MEGFMQLLQKIDKNQSFGKYNYTKLSKNENAELQIYAMPCNLAKYAFIQIRPGIQGEMINKLEWLMGEIYTTFSVFALLFDIFITCES